MNELSIFVDESEDFGTYDHRAPYYISAGRQSMMP